MEDPWANAWEEPSKSNLPEPSNFAITSTWTAPSVSVIQGDHEDDISTPSWPVIPTTEWSEPDIAETSLWGADTTTAWKPAPSSFDKMSLASKDSSDTKPDHSLASDAQEETREASLPPSSSSSADDDSPQIVHHESADVPAFSPSPIVPSIALAPPEDLDAFGTFETALEVDDTEGWVSPSRPTFSMSSDDAWGTEQWGVSTPTPKKEAIEGVEDAWETARQQKAKQDLHVPPELLSSILRHFEELSSELWAAEKSSVEGPDDKEGNLDIDDLGLQSVLARLVPDDLGLPTNPPFSKTFTAKQLSEALRLTRHSISTRASPVALYMASKGSTSWEAAIKAKPIVGQEDFTPAGWKIVEAAKEDPLPTDDGKKKPNGGLLSFFQRKSTNPPLDEARRSASPVNISSVSSIKSGSSPRASVDSTRSSTVQAQVAGRSTPSSPNVASFGSMISSKNDPVAPKPPTPATTANDFSDAIMRVPTPPAPSAVSRFLGRFSGRARSSSRDSMALSSDDLEFLADVPTASSNDTSDGPSLDALSAMIKSPPLPTKLPAPLAPPPRATPQPRDFSQPSKSSAQNDNFMSFFDNLDAPPKSTNTSESSLSLLTDGPPPPAKSILPQIAVASLAHAGQIFQESKDSEDQSWAAFDHPSVSANNTTLPQSKRPFVAVMSSSKPSSTASTPPLLPKPVSAFSIPPPPSSSQQSSSNSFASGSSRVISPSPPPSRSHTPLRTQPVQSQLPPPNIEDDDDDFTDFLSSPAQATPPAPLSFSSFPSMTVPLISNPPTHTHTTTNLHDDFDGRMDSLPPQPPAKSIPLGPSTPPLPSLSPKLSRVSPAPQDGPNTLTRKNSRKADHSRTLSLLETAASRGRWLAPPSPLPEALPPPNSNNGKSSDINFLGGSMQAQQAQATNYLTNSTSFPALASKKGAWNFPPPLNAATLQPPPSMQSMQPTLSKYSIPKQPALLQPSLMQNGSSSASSGAAKTTGLSAQDLSFFEGL